MTMLNIGKDINGVPTSATTFSDICWTIQLTPSTLANFTIPNSYAVWQVFITCNYDANVFVALNQNAIIPTTTLTNTGSVMVANKLIKTVNGGDFLSFITSLTGVRLSVEYFAVKNV